VKKGIRNKRWFTAIIAVFLLGCGGPTPRPSAPPPSTPTPPESDGTTFNANKSFQADNGKSSLLFEDETIVRPEVDEGEINVHELTPQELNELEQDTPPPDGRKIITSLEIILDGMMFSPPATVKFDVSDRKGELKRGDVLELYTFNEERREWDLLGKADVDNEWFAVARILHTSIYAVMDKVGSISITDTSVPPNAPLTLTPSRIPTKTLTPSRTPTKTITPSITPSLTPLPNAEISGSIWEDSNKNGSIDFGETTGLGGVNVNLGIGSCSSVGFRQTSSNSSGFYDFTNLAAGTYCVSISITDSCKQNMSPTTSTSYTVFLSNGQSVSRNFGYVEPICID